MNELLCCSLDGEREREREGDANLKTRKANDQKQETRRSKRRNWGGDGKFSFFFSPRVFSILRLCSFVPSLHMTRVLGTIGSHRYKYTPVRWNFLLSAALGAPLKNEVVWHRSFLQGSGDNIVSLCEIPTYFAVYTLVSISKKQSTTTYIH